MPNAHIAYRVDYDTLIKNPEQVLQQISFKILEKRNSLLEGFVNNKVQFKNAHGIEQGICESVNSTHCNIRVGDKLLKVPTQKLIFPN